MKDGTDKKCAKWFRDTAKLEQDAGAMERLKVKESEWPLELFYNKTVNMYKRK